MWKSKTKPSAQFQPAFASYSPSILQPTPLQPTSASAIDPLIGPLPISVFARILNHSAVPDIPNVARTCRALAKLVRSDDRVWKSRCLSLGLYEGADAQGDRDNSPAHRRKRKPSTQPSRILLKYAPSLADSVSSRNGQASLTAAPINLNDDDFGDFASQPLATIDSGVSSNGTHTAEDEFEDVFGEFTSSAPPARAMDRTKSREKASVSLLDLDFEDGHDVPLPSTRTARATPQKSAQPAQSKRTSGFFAVNPAVLNTTSSPARPSFGQARTCESYQIYKAKHEQLTPYVRVLRSCSTATSSALTSTISASHALSLLFPPTQNGPTPLDVQASVLVDLLRFLSTAIEPTRDWGWLRRVLGGVCDRFEAVCLSAFDRAESIKPSPTASLHSTISTNSATAALRLVSEASWNVYRTTRETSPREKRYKAHAKETPSATGNVQESTVNVVLDLIDDQVEWELGRAWIEKREIFYEGAKWDSSKNVV
jgi:recyclin-1